MRDDPERFGIALAQFGGMSVPTAVVRQESAPDRSDSQEIGPTSTPLTVGPVDAYAEAYLRQHLPDPNTRQFHSEETLLGSPTSNADEGTLDNGTTRESTGLQTGRG
jgi:hypothetical protein